MEQRSAALTDSTGVAATYMTGKHIIVDGVGLRSASLNDVELFRAMIEPRIEMLGLVSVGTVYHAFPGGGFTAVVCLTESHLSIHTWPEHGRVTFDVFLSNFTKNNDAAGDGLVESIMDLLGPGEYHRTELRR